MREIKAFIARVRFVLKSELFKGQRLKIMKKFWREEYYDECDGHV